MVGMGVGVAVGVGVGVLVGVAVLVGVVVAVGNGVALGAGVVVGADTGAQADKIMLTSKNTSNVRFILRVLLWRSAAQRRALHLRREAQRSGVRCKRMLGGKRKPTLVHIDIGDGSIAFSLCFLVILLAHHSS